MIISILFFQSVNHLFMMVFIVVLSHLCLAVNNKLQHKQEKQGCEWGCSSDIDEKLRSCEDLCELRNSRNKNGEVVCQSNCASIYVSCFEECQRGSQLYKNPA
jgi:hypothetical protein